MVNPQNKDSNTHWNVFDDADALASEAAKRILNAASQSISERGVFRLVLSGGNTPKATYRLLVNADTDWSKWEIYYGDERCLGIDDPERNSVMAAKSFLDFVPIPAANIHAIPGEKGAEEAAKEYLDVIKGAMPFDLVMLGLGEDGHTASLFPGQKHPDDQLVFPVHNAPKPPPDRVSLSAHVLSNTPEVLVLATGTGKQDAIRAWQAGKPLPIATIGKPAVVDVFIDKAAQP